MRTCIIENFVGKEERRLMFLLLLWMVKMLDDGLRLWNIYFSMTHLMEDIGFKGELFRCISSHTHFS